MATTCFLTLLLIIGAVGSGQPTTYDNPRIYGDCLVRANTLSIFMSPYTNELVIVRQFDMFRIQLPEQPGHYELQYRFRHETAQVMRQDEVLPLIPKETVIVRHGPKGFY